MLEAVGAVTLVCCVQTIVLTIESHFSLFTSIYRNHNPSLRLGHNVCVNVDVSGLKRRECNPAVTIEVSTIVSKYGANAKSKQRRRAVLLNSLPECSKKQPAFAAVLIRSCDCVSFLLVRLLLNSPSESACAGFRFL